MPRKNRENHEAVVRRSLEFALSKISEPLSINQIADHVGYSDSRLKSIFKKITGRGILDQVLGLRFEKAKQLLTQTQLGIGEIALEIGFNNHEHFTRLFRKRTGMSPSQYRGTVQCAGNANAEDSGARRSAEIREWFADNFEGSRLGKDWRVRNGRFVAETNCAFGEAEELFTLHLARSLPENFEVSLDLLFQFESSEKATHFVLYLLDDTESIYTYVLTLDARERDPSELRHLGAVRCIALNLPTKRDQWQTIRLRLFDDTLTLHLDDHKIFEFRNDFPPAYKDRSRLSLGCWQSSVRFKNLLVTDLGFPPLIRAVRQGDSLYLAGVYDAAKDFYARLLESEASLTDTMELYYKIGMCFLGQGSYGLARGWFEKITTPRENDFWSQKARLQEVLIDFLLGREKACTDATKYFAISAMRDDLRSILQRVSHHYQRRGFEKQSLSPDRLLLELEEDGSFFSVNARLRSAETLFLFDRNAEAEMCLRHILSAPKAPMTLTLEALLALGHACIIQGKFDEALICYDQFRKRTTNRFTRIRCEVPTAFILRGKEKIEESVELLISIWTHREQVPRLAAYAKLEVALLHCARREVDVARTIISQAQELGQGLSWLQVGQRSRYLYVPELVSGNFEKAAEILLEDARFGDTDIFVHAGQAAKAAAILDIAGKSTEARKVWIEITRRFPASQCGYYASLAHAMTEGNETAFPNMLGGAYERSELFYLAAAMYEKRGDVNRSTDLLRASLNEDPTLRWPAYLAKQKLNKINAEAA